MKGKLIKDHEGWWVQHKAKGLDGNLEYIAESMLHPDDIKQIEEDAKVFDSIGARIAAYPDVEFEMVTEVVASIGDSEEQDEYTISYAKLIPSKEPSYELEYNRYMKTFVNSNLTPPTIEEFVNKVNTDSDFAKYWGPGGKEQQKQLITEIMDLDAKDGLYEDDVKKLAEDWCKSIGEDGFVNSGDDYDIHELPAFIAGYNKAKETLYTEEQVREAIKKATTRKYNSHFYNADEIIQSLKQPKKD